MPNQIQKVKAMFLQDFGYPVSEYKDRINVCSLAFITWLNHHNYNAAFYVTPLSQSLVVNWRPQDYWIHNWCKLMSLYSTQTQYQASSAKWETCIPNKYPRIQTCSGFPGFYSLVFSMFMLEMLPELVEIHWTCCTTWKNL